jgi:ubiquinone/menaquinone biosynthesis C-methylase UbiE
MPNEKQITYWNEIAGPKWVKTDGAMEARLAAINDLLLERAAPKPGDFILDIGCGTGTTARPFAAAGAYVTGIDISAPMLAAARAIGGNITYLEADAQTHDFGHRKFDQMISRFGVMFFSDPVGAFKNLYRALAETGRLTFICWAPLADNPHWQIPFDLACARLGPPTPRHPHAPGPLAFADAAYVNTILTDAGFTNITITPTQVPIIGQSIEEEAEVACLFGPAGALIEEKKPDPATRAEILESIKRALAQFKTEDGLSSPATVHIVTAKS